jgi:VanZ family protein
VTLQQWLKSHPLIYLWLPLIAWMGLIFFLSAQPDLPHPDTGWADFLLSSLAHSFMFGVLALLWIRILENRSRAGWLAFLLTLLYAFSDEFHQAFVPGRVPDPWDLACDALGAGLVLLVWAWWRQHRQSGSSVGRYKATRD